MSWSTWMFGSGQTGHVPPSTPTASVTGTDLGFEMVDEDSISATPSEPVVVAQPTHEQPIIVKKPETRERSGFVVVDDDGGFSVSGGTLITIIVIPIIAYIGWSYAKDFLADFMKQEATTPRRQFSSLVGLGGIDTSTKRQFKSLFCFLRTDSLARRQFASFVPFSSEGSLTGRQMISLVSSNEVTTSATRQLRSLAFLREVQPPTWLERITSRLTFS